MNALQDADKEKKQETIASTKEKRAEQQGLCRYTNANILDMLHHAMPIVDPRNAGRGRRGVGVKRRTVLLRKFMNWSTAGEIRHVESLIRLRSRYPNSDIFVPGVGAHDSRKCDRHKPFSRV
jgi:hypothetical protein